MNISTIYGAFKMYLTTTHAVAFYGLHTEKNGFIKHDRTFNERTDLSGHVDADIASKVVTSLDSFGVDGVKVDRIEYGPVITRVNLVLPQGTRIKTVESLAEDIAMQLKVPSVSFTQVPVKGVLALDIPSEHRKTVRFGNVHTDDHTDMDLPLELGVSVTGAARAIDLAKSPHLLIAGQTGSGKSVCVNALICSLLRNVSLADFDLLLVDPKGVELNEYKKLPNCINGKILVSPEDSLQGLRWLCKEMDRRYDLLTQSNCRNISKYNEWVRGQPIGIGCAEKMRYVVCVVDEFADLMMTAGVELTSIVQRLAQKSRAVGIHLVLATQRPSTKVVTGDLKANLPCRIAFKVSSAVDSVTILGHGGAERLLGKGDMILSSDRGEERLHGVYLTDDEIRLLARIAYLSTVSSILRTVDFADGTWSNTLGVPSWALETMSESGVRTLASDSPEWLRTLVETNRQVWGGGIDPDKFNLGVLVCRMAKHFMKIERLRSIAEPLIDPICGKIYVRDGIGWDKMLFDSVMDILLRLKTSTVYGLGFSKDNVCNAQQHKLPYNTDLEYLRHVA